MKQLLFISILLTAILSSATTGEEIKSLSQQTNSRIQKFNAYSTLSEGEKRTLFSELRYLIDLLDNLQIDTIADSPRFICAKQSNGRYYPSDIKTFEVVGATGMNASYPDIQSCKETLPTPNDRFICAKENNGRFYPASAQTFQIVGATGMNASYPNFVHCKETLPLPNQLVACAKQNNGRYYPVSAKTFEVLGSTSINASYPNFKDCNETL